MKQKQYCLLGNAEPDERPFPNELNVWLSEFALPLYEAPLKAGP